MSKSITELPQKEVKPFKHVREALHEAHKVADVVVVSAALLVGVPLLAL